MFPAIQLGKLTTAPVSPERAGGDTRSACLVGVSGNSSVTPGFSYQVAFVRVLGRFSQQAPLEINGEILRFAALQLGAAAETIHAYAGRQQTVSDHQHRIGEYLRLGASDAAGSERMARFLEDEALRLERTASLLARARAWLYDEHVLAPGDSVLRRAVGAARHCSHVVSLSCLWLLSRLAPVAPSFAGAAATSAAWPARARRDHCATACIGLHAAKRGTRFEALEPIRQGIRERFGGIGEGVARGLRLRHDHGSNYLADDFQQEVAFFGIESSPSFVREPEGNGVAERFIRTLKENLLWVRSFETIEELRLALLEFKRTYNEQWMLEKYDYRSPAQVRRDLLGLDAAA